MLQLLYVLAGHESRIVGFQMLYRASRGKDLEPFRRPAIDGTHKPERC